jgi:hypothetical protein
MKIEVYTIWLLLPLLLLASLPELSAQPAIQPEHAIVCSKDIVTYSVILPDGPASYYRWQVSSDKGGVWINIENGMPYSGSLTSSLSINPASLSLSGNLYRCVITNSDGVLNSNAALLTVNNCSVSGTVKYNNTQQDALAGFVVTINGLSAKTDASGAFTINGLTSGVFYITVNNNTTTAGAVNSTDAAGINYWTAFPTPVLNVRAQAGNVNSDNLIDRSDAQAIQNFFVLAKSFVRSPWVYWSDNGSGISDPQPFTVTINGSSISGFGILAMCTGDFNSSFVPNIRAGSQCLKFTNSGDLITAETLKEFDLPLKAGSHMHVSAISLILNVPSNLVKVIGVKVHGSQVPVTYNVTGNELRIGWNSTAAVSVPAGGNLIILTLIPTASFAGVQTLRLSMINNYLNELADAGFNPITTAELMADDVEVTPQGTPDPVVLTANPNPGTVSTTITYHIPVPGTVNLGIYNVLGNNVKMLVPNYNMAAGEYSVNVDVSALQRGVYYTKLTLKSGSGYMVKAIRFIKK